MNSMAKSSQNGDLKEQLSGYKNGLQTRKFLRLAVALSIVVVITTFYLLGDLTTDGYLFVIRHMEASGAGDGSMFFTYMNSNLAGTPPSGYVVWSPSCRIPDVPILHESIRKFVYIVKPVQCASTPHLTSIAKENGSHILQVHKEIAVKYYKDPSPNCCYSLITRQDSAENATNIESADDNFSISKCTHFSDNVTFTKEEQFVKVKCTTKSKKKKDLYNNIHAFVRRKKNLQKKIRQVFVDTKSESDRKLSVMFVGIDSVSRLNFLRTMPKTSAYLQQNNWISLKGYNKMDDNTFPNLMAILTGHTVNQITQLCWRHRKQKLDNCPFIWYNYSSNGYVTCYAEDEPTIGSFNYRKSGFQKTPTDYYLRPFMLAGEKRLKMKTINSLNVCIGPTATPDHILDYAVDFVHTFNGALTFSLFWMNSYSHNDLNSPSLIDSRVLKFFKDLEKTGALDTTLVIFLSDHGMRFGKIRETYVGWLEERLPYIYFWLPDWFQRIHPEKTKSLMKNVNRLTSPFDVHVTLLDILGQKPIGPAGCPTCQTLFKEVAWNRTCLDAGITDHWCTCSEYKTLSLDSSPVLAIARHVLDELNKLVENGSHNLSNRTKCAKLKLKRVLSLRSKIFTRKIGYKEFVILLQTVPGEAMFEATVRHKSTFQIMDTVSRINTYGSQSNCMKDAFLQKYCFCEKVT
ncbi:uncharacterized protein isoform X2 [Rhodnius prolixus]